MKETKSTASLKKKSKAKKTKKKKKDSRISAQQLSSLMKLMEFSQEHRKLDLTLSWNIKLLRADGSSFCQSKGSSTQPRILSPTMLPTAPSQIQKEITDKVVKPFESEVAAKLMLKLSEPQAIQGQNKDFSSEEECFGQDNGEAFMPGETPAPASSSTQHVE